MFFVLRHAAPEVQLEMLRNPTFRHLIDANAVEIWNLNLEPSTGGLVGAGPGPGPGCSLLVDTPPNRYNAKIEIRDSERSKF